MRLRLLLLCRLAEGIVCAGSVGAQCCETDTIGELADLRFSAGLGRSEVRRIGDEFVRHFSVAAYCDITTW